MAPRIDTRCLECSHEFPTEVLVLTDSGWACPKCQSVNVERILAAFKYDETKIKYEEGNGHD